MPFLLLLVLLLHYGEDKCCSNFRRWCRRYVAVFTAVGAAITLWRGQMLLKFSPLVSALRFIFAEGTNVYAVARRGLFIVLRNDYVNTSRGNTAALFCLPRSLTQHAPCCPFPFLAFVPVHKWFPPETRLLRHGPSGRLPARAEDDGVQIIPPVHRRPTGHRGPMRDRSPATRGARGTKAPPAAPSPAKVHSQRRTRSNARLTWRKLPPTRGLAGSGGRLLLPRHTTTSDPAPRAVRERARPPL